MEEAEELASARQEHVSHTHVVVVVALIVALYYSDSLDWWYFEAWPVIYMRLFEAVHAIVSVVK